MSLGEVCLKSLQRRLFLLVLIKRVGYSDTPAPWSHCVERGKDVGHKFVLDLRLI